MARSSLRAGFRVLALTAGLAMLTGCGRATSSRSPEVVDVDLGRHRFGQLSEPEAVVADAGPDRVGYPPAGEGCCGPNSFAIGVDGSVWVLDGRNQRLLVWEAGNTSQATTVRLPKDCCEDFALGVAGDGDTVVYAARSGTAEHPLDFLYRLDLDGAVEWQGDLNATGFPVRLTTVGRRLYAFREFRWFPATSESGEALPLGEQRSEEAGQPLPGGQRLEVRRFSAHRFAVDLRDRTGALQRSWRIRSQTPLEGPVLEASPALVEHDPVVFLQTTVSPDAPDEPWEYVVLRLTPSGAEVLALSHRPPLAGWGDMITALTVGPDGKLYQLGGDPETGITVRRFTLDPGGP